ncbi:MAG: Rieske 2Fe-2S domain-containing protein [Anaerolineales bacterium]|nr:Rieske 2Fe-2S domain-containing protein [Anaerolineales bacterium]
MREKPHTFTSKRITRRDTLKIAWATLGGLATLELGGITLAYMQPRAAQGKFGGQIAAGKVDDFPAGSVTHIPEGRFYLARLIDGGFLAMYHRCTHLGCTVPWDQQAEQFVCPCHSSRFSMEGNVVTAPAPRALDLFPVKIENGVVLVDTSQPIQRQSFDPAQVVYA